VKSKDEVSSIESKIMNTTANHYSNGTLISESISQGNNTSNRLVEECVSAAIIKFSEIEPERAYVLDLLVEGIEGKEIAERIGRTYAATRQYLSECRKHLMPFVGECYELLNT
jgi:DNA-binding NarL/FixJ family response regulator